MDSLPNTTDRVRVLRRPSCDYLRVAGQVSPGECGFVKDERFPSHMNRWWRPGWCGHLKALRNGVHTFIAWADRNARQWPQPWGERLHITRVDVCCDISISTHNRIPQHFKQEHRHLFTYRGSGNDVFKKHEVATLYVNSRESPVTLRIYKKSEHCDSADKALWSANGWGGEDVWRVEYEYHNKVSRPVLPDNFSCPRDVAVLWADALARVRMCSVPPRSCSQQNKAPTHPWWVALGSAARLTRKRGELTATPQTERARLMASLARLLDKADPSMLGAFAGCIARQQRMMTATLHERGVTAEESRDNGEGREEGRAT